MDESRQITTIIKDHIEGLAIREGIKGLLNTPSVLFFGFTLPCEDWDTSSGNTLSLMTSVSGSRIHAAQKLLTPPPHDLEWSRCSI